MKLKSCCKELFRSLDLFSVTQFLRYKQDESFKTVSGGVTSLIILIIFIVLFGNKAIQTINRSIINWTSTTENLYEPTPYVLNFQPGNKFLFTVGIVGFNLNDPAERYFDIQVIETHIGSGAVPLGSRVVNLEPCTPEHFSITQQLKNSYDTVLANTRLCPPLNYSSSIYGKFTSKEMQFLQIRISKCNSSLNSSRPCANESIIDYMLSMMGQFNAGFFYVNPLINPGDSNYLDYYFEDRNFLAFDKKLGAYSIAHVQQFEINTDQSLLPFTEIKTQEGIIIPELFQTIPYSVTNQTYASFYLMKSSTKVTYDRSFNKIDQFFSYVGGLVGTILGLMLFMGNFSSMAFELDISQKLFFFNSQDTSTFSHFNIGTYFKYMIYKLAGFFGKFKDWTDMNKASKCQEEISKQLDIGLLLKRIAFLERAIESLLEHEQIQPQRFYTRQSMAVVKTRRKKYAQSEVKDKKQTKNATSISSDSEESSQQSVQLQKMPSNSQIISESMPKSNFLFPGQDLQKQKQQNKQIPPRHKKRKNKTKENLFALPAAEVDDKYISQENLAPVSPDSEPKQIVTIKQLVKNHQLKQGQPDQNSSISGEQSKNNLQFEYVGSPKIK